jgi:EAL domain-containing protein (putative c-di-GMP-specific phosphodiesterase class I)
VVVYADGMAEDARRRADLQSDLAQAVAGGQLELHYQPVVALDGGDVVGHEALVRWRHPVRGLVPPVDFVPLAEQNGDIVEIGRWVLREAVRQAAAWTTDGAALRMAVNLSPRQLLDDDVPALVAVALADSGLPAARLTLEVTESVLVQDFDRVVGELARLRAMGVRIAIDDFGTGFSSLSYLRRLPTDVVKIDRSFVMELTEVDSTLTLVSSIIELARSLGLDVVAEGVETEAQRVVLERLECGQAQGYLFARPLPAGELDPTGRPRPVPLPA